MITEIRCSSLHRAMNCLGSLVIEDKLEQEAGQPAKDGTAVGELLTAMIHQRTPTPNVSPQASNGTFLDQDMWFHARDVYDLMCSRLRGTNIESEERIDWMTPAGIKIRGQFDASYVIGNTLMIDDLKYGWGIVEAEKNWQLIGYAIGQAFRLKTLHGYWPEWVNMTIHQPRPYHPKGRTREWMISVKELELYYNQICEQMTKFTSGDRTLSTSTSCKYCPAAHNCPALRNANYNAIDVIMRDWDEKAMSNEFASNELALIERAKAILDIKKSSLEQLITMRLKEGQIVPGYAFDMDYGDRKWKPGVTAQGIYGMTEIDITKTEMLSPNQAEKRGVPRKLVAQLTERVEKGLKLRKADTLEEAQAVLKQQPTL